MPENTKELLAEIEKFLKQSSMRPGTFGHKTVSDGKLVQRLRRGGTVTLETATKIKSFIASQRSKPRSKKASPCEAFA